MSTISVNHKFYAKRDYLPNLFFSHEWKTSFVCISMWNSMIQVQDVLEAAKVLEWLKENCTVEYIRR
jgi:hypothetical protein